MDSGKADWKSIETEYITTTISQRELAKKYGIPLRTITYQSRKGDWVEKRRQHCDKVAAKTQAKIEEKKATSAANRLLRLVEINDKLLDMLEESSEQLTRREIRRNVKIKKVESHKASEGEPATEITTETTGVELDFVEGDIDRDGLRKITASMKNIADIYLKERAARKEDESAEGIQITIAGADSAAAEDYSG